MPTEELAQAIEAAKWSSAEGDVAEAIARTLELSPEAVSRVVFAWEAIRAGLHRNSECREDVFDGLGEGRSLGLNLRTAIKTNVDQGIKRAIVRWAIVHNEYMRIPFQKLVSENNTIDMCSGCPMSIECISKNISTPKDCWNGKRHYREDDLTFWFSHINAQVKPIKIIGNIVTVTSVHPTGTFHVNAMHLLGL